MLQSRAAAAAQREKDRFERLLRAQQRDEAAAQELEMDAALSSGAAARLRRRLGRSLRGFHRTAEALRASFKAAGLDIALRSALFRKLTAIVVITGFAGGIGVLTIQYLQMRLTFRAREQAVYLQIYGVMGLLARRPGPPPRPAAPPAPFGLRVWVRAAGLLRAPAQPHPPCAAASRVYAADAQGARGAGDARRRPCCVDGAPRPASLPL